MSFKQNGDVCNYVAREEGVNNLGENGDIIYGRPFMQHKQEQKRRGAKTCSSSYKAQTFFLPL